MINLRLPSDDPPSITQLLNECAQGHDQALNQLFPMIYDDLKRRAKSQMWKERDDHTLQSTALVHEAFIRLGDRRGWKWASRDQFFAWMTRLMRQVLIDHARAHNAFKKGSGIKPQSLDAAQESGEELPPSTSNAEWEAVLEMNQVLDRLEKIDSRQARIVEMHVFGGLSTDQMAQALNLSAATVRREWKMARLWVLDQLGKLR